MMTPSVQSILRVTYDAPMFEGLPPGTRWAGNPNHPLWWDARHECYHIGLTTYLGPKDGYFFTLATIERHELDRLHYMSTLAAWQELVHDKLKLLRMQHYFGLVYRRGGYC